MRRVVTIGVVLVLSALALGRPDGASAAPRPSFAVPCSSAVDPATCERMEYVANELADDEARLDYAWWGSWFVAGLLVVLIVRPYWDRLFSWSRLPQ